MSEELQELLDEQERLEDENILAIQREVAAAKRLARFDGAQCDADALRFKDPEEKLDSTGADAGTADVYRGFYRRSKADIEVDVAIKVFRGTGSHTLASPHAKEIIRELLGCKIVHSNLVEFYGFAVVPSRGISLVMEFMNEGTLTQALTKTPSIEQRIKWLRDVAVGMEVLHFRQIMHRNLKSTSVLLKGGVAKVGNFSQSKATSAGSAVTGGMSTDAFTPPEAYRGRFYPESDVFSFAMIVFHAATLLSPFAGMPLHKILNLMLDDSKSQEQKRPNTNVLAQSDWPAALQELVCLCWDEEPQKRVSFTYAKRLLSQQLLAMRRAAEAATVDASNAAEATAAAAASQTSTLELEVLLKEIRGLKDDIEALSLGQTAMREAMHDLKDDVAGIARQVRDNEAKIIERVEMLAKRITTAGLPKCPWLFTICPDKKNNPKRMFKKPKAWLKEELRIHLLCNGRKDLGVPPHFLHTKKEELAGKYRGYRILQASERLKKWAPVIKFVLAFLSLAAKAAAAAFIPGIGGALGALLEMGELADFAIDEVNDGIGSVCDSIIQELDFECGSGSADSWAAGEDASFTALQEDLADYIIARDKEKHQREFDGAAFMGLRSCQNSKPGAGNGNGTPIWLCPDCYPKTAPSVWSGGWKDLLKGVSKAGPGGGAGGGVDAGTSAGSGVPKVKSGEVRRANVVGGTSKTREPFGIQLASQSMSDGSGFVHVVTDFEIMPYHRLNVTLPRPKDEKLGIYFGKTADQIKGGKTVKKGEDTPFILRIEPGSIAEKQGIQPGDMVVAVAGDSFIGSAKDAIAKYPAEITLTLHRNIQTPAQKCGVAIDDVLLEVNGTETSGKANKQVVEMLKAAGERAVLVLGKGRPLSGMTPE